MRALFSTRSGGVSQSPFHSLNLGDHVGDAAQAVSANRAVFTQRLGGSIEPTDGVRPIFLNQVHGTHVVALDVDTPDGTVADACLSVQRGLACTIMVADCLPVLLTDQAGSFVAAAHAGWRGLAGQDGSGVLESVIAAIMAGSSRTTATLIAWLGPCIGPDAFEVGDEVRSVFVSHDARAATCFTPITSGMPGKWLCDLQGLARQRLNSLGVAHVYGNDGSTDWCTVSNPSRFFSHRRDRVSGRMAASIWLA